MNYSFLIGVEKYLVEEFNLNYIENDINAISDALENIEYKKENSFILLNNHASKAWIESKLKQLTSILDKENDSIIFYYAGHGINYEGTNFLTCYDTNKDDIQSTSIPIKYIFDLLGKACNKVILLLDACHSGITFDGLARNIASPVSDDFYKQICKNNNYWVILSACMDNETSNPIKQYKHGVWTYHLIQCLQGKILSVLDEANNLILPKLQDYLVKQVSADIKHNFTNKKQTPWKFEASLGPAIIGTLINVPARKIIKTPATNYNLLFEYIKSDKIKYLSGFQKFHTVPTGITSSTKLFVQSISKEELKSSSDKIFQILKNELEYKRKDIQFEEGDGSCEFTTPDFSIEININQDEKNASMYTTQIKLYNLNLEIILDDKFNSAFEDFFDRLIINIDSLINITNLIDYLQENNIDVDYPTDLSTCSFELDNSTISFSENQIEIERKHSTPKELLLSISNKNTTIKNLQDSNYIPYIQNNLDLLNHDSGKKPD